MEWLTNLSDNELAVLGCFGALAVSFAVVSGSYHFGRIVRHARTETEGMTNQPAASLHEHPVSGRRAA